MRAQQRNSEVTMARGKAGSAGQPGHRPMPVRESSATAGNSLRTVGSGYGHVGPGVQPTATRLASGAVGQGTEGDRSDIQNNVNMV